MFNKNPPEPVIFPTEIWLTIFGFLDEKELLPVAKVCKFLCYVSQLDVLWRPMIHRDINKENPDDLRLSNEYLKKTYHRLSLIKLNQLFTTLSTLDDVPTRKEHFFQGLKKANPHYQEKLEKQFLTDPEFLIELFKGGGFYALKYAHRNYPERYTDKIVETVLSHDALFKMVFFNFHCSLLEFCEEIPTHSSKLLDAILQNEEWFAHIMYHGQKAIDDLNEKLPKDYAIRFKNKYDHQNSISDHIYSPRH